MSTETAVLTNDYETERGKPMPSKLHSLVQMRLGFQLMKLYQSQYQVFSELTLGTTDDRTIVPDLSIYDTELIDFTQDEIRVNEPPLAVMEILSPSQVLQTLVDKTNDYFTFGVKSVWLVLPSLKSIYVFTAPHEYQVYTNGQEVVDPNINVRLSIDELFAA